ncbi:MAG: ABC transporter ATP-binding protein [Anaerosomatales bacterium]|nr:ABC transporter ATP-binding protein [Anaerosomatales bacterium]
MSASDVSSMPDSSQASTFEVRNLKKHFAGLKAVDGVSFSVRTGEILGLIGPNGSGKTTLVNVVTGLLPATEGSILLDGEDLTRRPAHDRARKGLARTFQTVRLFGQMTVLENVEAAVVSTGHRRRHAASQAMEVLADLGLADQAHRLAREIPFGHQRKLEIARALAMRPKFVFLDEPAAGLNEQESDELDDLLRRIPGQYSVGLVVIEHDMRLMMNLCPRLHVLNYGKTIAEGTPDEVRSNHEVVTAYLGSRA